MRRQLIPDGSAAAHGGLSTAACAVALPGWIAPWLPHQVIHVRVGLRSGWQRGGLAAWWACQSIALSVAQATAPPALSERPPLWRGA